MDPQYSITRVPDKVYTLWKMRLQSTYESIPNMQDLLRSLIRTFMLKEHPGQIIVAFGEFGVQDAWAIESKTGVELTPGFYIKHRDLKDEELWQLESGGELTQQNMLQLPQSHKQITNGSLPTTI